MPSKPTLCQQFNDEHSDRQASLKRAIQCASLSKPHILPPENWKERDELPENFQSLVSYGLTNLTGKTLLAMFPPGSPWFRQALAARIRQDPNLPDEAKQEIEQALFRQDVIATAMLEQNQLSTKANKRRKGFRTHKRQVIDQILATGDTLESMDDDYRLRLYRRDRYTTKRDDAGDVEHHIVKERLDVARLDESTRQQCNIDSDILSKRPNERTKDLYTRVSWQHEAKVWLIEQELNEVVFTTSEEPVSPYFSTTFELPPNANYGRGFIELNYGDCRSYDELAERILDFAHLSSRHLMANDDPSTSDDELKSPSGSIINAQVQNGQVQRIGFIQANRIADFQVSFNAFQSLENRLSKAMLIESAIQPHQERVTAQQIQRIAQEVDGALGGFYAPMADEQQIPLVERLMYQLRRDNLIEPMPSESTSVRVLTGIEAIAKQLQVGKVLNFAATIAQLGEQALAKLNMDVLIDVVARYEGINEPGLIKSNEALAQERQQQLAAAVAAKAADKTVEVAGNVAEATATQQNGEQTNA
jgi:hypothetical protein